jgi:hypothetical protein
VQLSADSLRAVLLETTTADYQLGSCVRAQEANILILHRIKTPQDTARHETINRASPALPHARPFHQSQPPPCERHCLRDCDERKPCAVSVTCRAPGSSHGLLDVNLWKRACTRCTVRTHHQTRSSPFLRQIKPDPNPHKIYNKKIRRKRPNSSRELLWSARSAAALRTR